MDLILKRKWFREDGIFSELSSDDCKPIAVTLEHSYLWDLCYSPKIPEGKYQCVRGLHRLPGMDNNFTTFEVMNVPGHSNILFHRGNFNSDSEGCILVGTTIVENYLRWYVDQSKTAFNFFMKQQTGIDVFNLTVIGY